MRKRQSYGRHGRQVFTICERIPQSRHLEELQTVLLHGLVFRHAPAISGELAVTLGLVGHGKQPHPS